MKSKSIRRCTACILLSLIFLSCKKELKQTSQNTLENGSSSMFDVTCIPNSISFFKTESLSQARGDHGPVGIGLTNKVLFVGGIKNDGNLSKRVDIYNTVSDSWTYKLLSERKWNPAIAAAGTKIGIAGGVDPYTGNSSDQVDIYDVITDTWTVSHLSSQREGAGGVGYGNFLYFAGGSTGLQPTKTIDVYNTLDGSWSKLHLSQARYYIAAAATNNKIVFAGGLVINAPSKRVDIYDVPSGTWTVSTLSKPRRQMVSAALGTLIIFAGGFDGNDNPSNTIDIYNTTTGQWSVSNLSSASSWSRSAVQGTKMFFSGFGNGSGPSVVDVYDICFNSWGKVLLTDGRGGFGDGAAGGKVLFGGGSLNGSFVKTVDIFSLGTLIAQ